MEWLTENWLEVLSIILGLHTTASAITALTPTPKDDAFIKQFYNVIETLALVVGKAKQK